MNQQGIHSQEPLFQETENHRLTIQEYENRIQQLSEQLEKEKKVRKQLEAKDLHSRQLLQHIPQLAWIILPKGRAVFVNQAWCDYTGQSLKEAKGSGWQQLVHPDDLPAMMAFFQPGKEKTEHVSEIRYLRASDKTFRRHLTRVNPVLDTKGRITGWTVVCTDIEVQKGEDSSLQNTEEQFRSIVGFIPQIVWTARPDGYEDFHNQRFTEYAGISRELTGGYGWQQIVHPEDLPGTREAWKRSQQSGEPYEVKYRLRQHDGAYRWFLSRALPLRDQEGTIIKWFGTSTDIHEVNESKLQAEKANQKLTRINQVLDTFVYMAAHDLKSPVGNLKTLLQLQAKVEEADKRQEFQRMIEYSVDKLNLTVSGLIEVITVEASQSPAKQVRLQEVINAVLAENSVQFIKSQGHIITDFNGYESIPFNESYLYSIFRNLLTNAIKYHHPDRPLEITITARKEESYFVITVTDNGIGIDMDAHRDKVFKPFKRFTTQAHGTGVGLYIIQNIVEKNGGRIEVESQLHTGTTFRVYLREYKN